MAMTREEITERLKYLSKVIYKGYDTASKQSRMSHPNAKLLAQRTMDYVRAFEREREELRKELMAMDKVDEVQYYVGKTFLVKLPTGILGIIHVADFIEKGLDYDEDSYVGWVTYIFKDGRSTESPWACERESFEKKDKQLIRG